MRIDLKLDNILVTFEDQSIIDSFVKGQAKNPMPRKLIDGPAIYLCHNNFGDLDGKPALKKIFSKITDFGLAEQGDDPELHIHPIQPNHCHAPEVLLGTGWSYSTDIWNFGILVRGIAALVLNRSRWQRSNFMSLGLGSSCRPRAVSDGSCPRRPLI